MKKIVFSILILLFLQNIAEAETSSSEDSSEIKPYLTYRYTVLQPREESVYKKKLHKDNVDQVYATFRFDRQVNYVNQVVLEPTMRTIRDNPRQYQWLFEQAFIDTKISKKLFVTGGKKSEFSGSGFFAQPSNLYQEFKDMFDPLYQNEGIVFSRLQFRGENTSFGIGLLPETGKDRKNGNAMAGITTELLQAEVDLQFKYNFERERSVTGLSVARFFGEIVEIHFDGSYRNFQKNSNAFIPVTDFDLDGADYSGGHYLWRDYSAVEEMDASGFYLMGTRLVLSPRRTLLAEYITQQNGLLPEEFERLFGDLKAEQEKSDTNEAVAKIPRNLRGRHYAALSFQDDDTFDGVHVGVSYVSNLDDKSGYGGMSVKKFFSKATSFEFSPTIFVGKSFTEFGEMPFAVGYNLLLRGRF